MDEQKSTILIVDDDSDVTDVLETVLPEAGYRVCVTRSAREAFTALFKMPVHLVILDINLPDLDGFAVVKEIKRNLMLRHIPVILLSGRGDFLDRMAALDVTVDEYLAKPFNIQDLLLRVKLVPVRAQSNLNANPLTRLPGNTEITKAIAERIEKKKPYAVAYADLNNFKAFNDKYGFQEGDKVIAFTAKTIVQAVQKVTPLDNFVGHIGGDDFVFICPADKAKEVCEIITQTFDKNAPTFYSEEDRAKGFIVVKDRRGVISHFPILSLAIGLAVDDGGKFSNLGQINQALSDLKKYAKSFEGSAYVRDRRTPAPDAPAATNANLERLADALTASLGAQFKKILDSESVTVLFQPVITVGTGDVMGHEGLVRGPAGSPYEFPEALFKAARANGSVAPLDVMCMKKVLMAARALHAGVKRFVNIYPETILNEDRVDDVLAMFPDQTKDVVFELSGSQRQRDAAELLVSLKRMKAKGVRICLDVESTPIEKDTRALNELQPDFVKVNMSVFKDLENDHERRAAFLKIVALIRSVGSQAICSKLELRSDYHFLAKAGVTLAQGFLFAPPTKL